MFHFLTWGVAEFRVWGLRVGVWCLGFGDLGFRVWGLGFRVWDLGFRADMAPAPIPENRDPMS